VLLKCGENLDGHGQARGVAVVILQVGQISGHEVGTTGGIAATSRRMAGLLPKNSKPPWAILIRAAVIATAVAP
jgi:hypothetical protein